MGLGSSAVLCGAGVGLNGNLQKMATASFPLAQLSVTFVSTESNGGNPKPWGLGHAWEAVSHWCGDQNVGYSLLCNAEAVQRRNTEVRHIMVQASDWSLNEEKT